jgi:DNA-binding transcriptional ArsR family regulator
MTVQTNQQGVDQRLIRAMGNPLRQRILLALNKRVASPSELSKELEEPLGNVSYHVRILVQCDAIELVKTEPVRGALEHFYRATIRTHFDDESWTELPESVRSALFGQTLRQIWTHVAKASEAGGFEHPKDHVSWLNLDLDEQGFADMVDHMNESLERAMEIQEEAANRRAINPPESEDDSYRTEFVLMHFHRA